VSGVGRSATDESFAHATPLLRKPVNEMTVSPRQQTTTTLDNDVIRSVISSKLVRSLRAACTHHVAFVFR